MKSNILIRASLLVLSICLAFDFLEVIFRYYYYRWNTNQSVPFVLFSRTFPESDSLRNAIQASPLTGVVFELKHNLHFNFFHIPLQTNSVGMISDREFTEGKPPNTIRIAGVGDSFMFPWGVGMHDTYLSIIGDQLSHIFSGKRIEMLNFSVPGYNTAIEYALIREKVLRYHPDFIILGYINNDMDMPNYIRRKIITSSYTLYVLRQLSALASCQFLSRCVNYDSTSLNDVPLSNESATRYPFTVEETPPEYQYMIGEKNYIHAMQQISDLTIKNQIPVLLATRQEANIVSLLPRLKSMGFIVFRGDAALEIFKDKALAERSDFVISPYDSHFSQYGDRAFAALLTQFIVNNRDLLHL